MMKTKEFEGPDEWVFNQLYKRYAKRIYAFCRRLLWDPGEAEIAAQEAFLRAWKSRNAFEAGRPFLPWIMQISRRECFRLLKKPHPVPESSLPQAAGNDAGQQAQLLTQTLIDQSTLATPKAVLQETLRRNLDWLEEHSPLQYTVVVKCLIEEKSIAQAAQECRVPEGTVKSRLNTARRRLKEARNFVEDEVNPAPEKR